MNANVDLMGLNGGVGALANQIMANGSMNFGRMRPFVAEDGN